jgi:hypothetical protein
MTSAVPLDRASFRAGIVPVPRGSRHSRARPAADRKYPSKLAGIDTTCLDQIGGQIGLDAIIIKERIVDIEEKDEVMHRGHGPTAFGFGLCHGPSGPMSWLASSGPQLPCA